MDAGAGAPGVGLSAKPDETGEVKYRKSHLAHRRRRRDRFIMIPRALLVHPDWTHLPAAARVIFLDMCKIHHHRSERGPGNNGEIGYGCVAGANAANVSPTTAHRMLKELRNGGLLQLRREGMFRVKAGDGRAAEWEITIYPMPGRPPIRWGESRLHIEHWLLECAAHKGLSNPAKCVLIEVMRRYDGGNNGDISFGGAGGAYAGFSTDFTERALIELERTGFLVQTAPAVPHLSQPRQWRLTMYAADGKSATKDFMRDASLSSVEKSYGGFTGAGKSPENVSMMRVSSKRHVPAVQAYAGEIPNDHCGLAHPSPNLGTRPGETLKAPDIRVSETHLEASPVKDRLSGCSPVGASAAQRYTKVTKSAERDCDIPRTEPSPVVGMVEPRDLFGDGLPYMRGPQHELRIELRATLARRRGTQSSLAKAVGLSRSTFVHALNGRSGFTLTAAAALRRWLDGEPVAGDWPAVPASEEENAA